MSYCLGDLGQGSMWVVHCHGPIMEQIYYFVSCFSASHEIPHLVWNPKVQCSMLKTVHHLPHSCGRWIQSMASHPVALRLISLLTSHVFPGLTCCLFH